MAERIRITLCLSPKAGQVTEWALELPAHATVHHACVLASQEANWPAACADWTQLQPAVWGQRVQWATVLQHGQRLELCRPLRVDPKVARRLRFAKQGAGRTGLFARKRPGAAAGY